MNPFIPFHNITPLESMMIQIKEDGQAETWQFIESINNPLHRAEARKLFAQAIKKLEEN